MAALSGLSLSGLYTESMTPASEINTAIDFKKVNLSDGSITREKMMGNMTDIFAATVVTDRPAFLVEYATRKNRRMNMIPMIMLMGSQRASRMDPGSISPG